MITTPLNIDMKVINIDSWAGLEFDHRPGAEIDLPDHIAKARILAGLAKLPDPPKPVKPGKDESL